MSQEYKECDYCAFVNSVYGHTSIRQGRLLQPWPKKRSPSESIDAIDRQEHRLVENDEEVLVGRRIRDRVLLDPGVGPD